MAQIKINMVAETVKIINTELDNYNEIITEDMKHLLREHICYVFEHDMEAVDSFESLNAFFKKIRDYVNSLFKARAYPNPFNIRSVPLGGNPLAGKPFTTQPYILCDSKAEGYRA